MKTACARGGSPPASFCHGGNRRLGCLSIFLFVALCASLFVNFVLTVAAFQRLAGVREAEPMPRFREILLQRGARASLRQDRCHHHARPDQFVASRQRERFDGRRHARGAATGPRR